MVSEFNSNVPFTLSQRFSTTEDLTSWLATEKREKHININYTHQNTELVLG